MITFSTVKGFSFDKLKRRVIKLIQFGAKTADQAAPFGDDSSPLNNMVAIYGKTSENGETVVLGYLNKDQIAQPGEKRIFSLKPDGTLSIDLYLKNDGTMEIGSNADNAVRYSKLNDALKAQDQKINMELAKIATAISSLGGTYPIQNISTDISQSKVEQVKIP
tara:strand:+ start:505 stop:996 length:492 start_codon:yes stop_codon:yes gene_type:complete